MKKIIVATMFGCILYAISYYKGLPSGIGCLTAIVVLNYLDKK